VSGRVAGTMADPALDPNAASTGDIDANAPPPDATGALHADVERVLLTETQIQGRVRDLGAELTRDYAGREPVMVSVLKGSIMFLADLIRATDLPLSLDLMEVSSYGAGTESSGLVRILKDLSGPIEGRDVIVVEDIIDTGLTLNYLLRYLEGKHPASLAICALLDKPARRLVEIPIAYRGFAIPDQFVVGYGLDYAERYRNLPYVGVLRTSVYAEVGEPAPAPDTPPPRAFAPGDSA
jgi:hypoxanthine phosphoribosyltransferase